MASNQRLSDPDLGIGQLFMIGIPGPQLDGDTERLIRDYNPAGIILFSRNIEGPLQVAGLCRDLQDAAMKHHGNSLFLAVDQEGGRVARLGQPFSLFPGNVSIGKDPEPVERAREFGMITAREMTLVGLNMNLAPVVDVQRGEPEKHLAGRMFGEDPEMTALLGRTVIRSFQEKGVMAVAKHFPGLGRARVDPHLRLPRIEAGLEEMQDVHLLPFRAAIEEGVSAIMTSHAIYPAMDSERPATLSREILTGLLREQMGFEGLIITDDLEMGAIKEHWGIPEGAAASFEAGADILLLCKEQAVLPDTLEAVRNRIQRREIPLQRLARSIERIGLARSRFVAGKEGISIEKVRAYFKGGT